MDRNSPLAHLLSILALPFWVVLLLPGYLHFYVSKRCCNLFDYIPELLSFFLGLPLLILGFFLFITTVRLFASKGKGTLAPWAPPTKLVVSGPYRHVRNPMLCAVNFLLLGIALMLRDENILLWQIFFFGLNTVYFIFKEEPDLEKRFGEEYVAYKKNVGRWLPRASPWIGKG